MKKILLPTLAMLGTLTAAADYSSFAFSTTDGQRIVVEAEGLKMAVVDGKLAVKSAGSLQSFDLTSLATMEFSNETTSGIENIDLFAPESPIRVVTIDGIEAGRFASLTEAFAGLPAGMYVGELTSNGSTFKFAVK